MFIFFKCKCIWFAYLYVVVFGADLSVSSLPKCGKQGCLGRICRESVSMRDAFFLPLSGLGTVDNYINYLDALDLTRVAMAPYGAHRQARQFERVSLYSGWLRCGERMVRYLPERVLRQFGWIQTIPRHPVQSAPVDINFAQIINCFLRALDYTLTTQELGEVAVHGVEAADGYIEWFYQVSHPRMILPDTPVSIGILPVNRARGIKLWKSKLMENIL
jgi:hypothetical protein